MTRADAIRGLLIYGAGDGLAAWIGGEFGWTRFAGMAAVGATVYAFEVPAWFRRIDRNVPAGGRAASFSVERDGFASPAASRSASSSCVCAADGSTARTAARSWSRSDV